MAQDFRKTVLKRLIDLGWTRKQLAEAVKEKSGMYCDSAYISKIFSGDRNAPKIRSAICEILEIEEA